MNLKILSYNIHKGFDWRNKNYFIQKMKEMITSLDVDLVFLQEVVGKNDKYKKNGFIDDQFELFADGIWPHSSYGKNAIYDHGHHGNLILSKYPIESFSNVNLSTTYFEKRGMLICKINVKGVLLYAINLHLNLGHLARNLQYKQIEKTLSLFSDQTPLVVAGDFNDWNKKAESSFVLNLQMTDVFKKINLVHAKTFPSFFPVLCLDRIYVKNVEVINSSIMFLKEKKQLSDHLPLFAEVKLDE